MNTQQTSPEQPTDQPTERTLGYWLHTVDRSIKRSMHDALTEDGLGRRASRTLGIINSGATSVEEIEAAMPPRRRGPKGFSRRNGFGPGRGFGHPVDDDRAEQAPANAEATAADAPTEHTGHEHHRPGRDHEFGRDFGRGHERDLGRGFGPGFGGAPFGPDARSGRGFSRAPFGPDFRGHHDPRGHRRSTEEVVMDLAARGLVTINADGITLTDAGREAHTALHSRVEAVRQSVTDAVSPEELATTLASLESIARATGWDENTANERGPRGRFGRGPRGHREGFAHRGHRRGGAERCGHEGHEHAEPAADASSPGDAR